MAKEPSRREAVLWYFLARVAGKWGGRAGRRKKLAEGTKYRVALRITGKADGQPVDESITGHVWRNPDTQPNEAMPGKHNVAIVLAALGAAERERVAKRAMRADPKKIPKRALELAALVIDAHRTRGSKGGDITVKLEE